MILTAPAKINLCLRVGPLRDDGFHRLATVFVAIDLRDTIELHPAPATSVEGFPDTLITRALEALGETRRVLVDKRIPVAAGLGGGSSDAAAVLRALRGRRPVDELYAIARSLGSDVPFFLSGLEVALGTGRGDVLQPLPEFPRSFGVLLVPSQERLSAADVYARAQPNEIYPAVRGDLIRGVHTVRSAADVAGLVANDLEPAAIELCPGIADALASVRVAGALAAAVSGSGPTVFGLFGDRASAEAARALIPGSIATAPVENGAMAEWNLSSDQVTLEQKPRRRSPVRWLRDNSIRIAVVVGFVEAAFAWHAGFRLMWLVGVLAVLSYLYLRRRVPVAVRRPLWVVAMSQAVAGIVVPAIFGLFFFAAIVGALLLVIMVLVLLGDLRRT